MTTHDCELSLAVWVPKNARQGWKVGRGRFLSRYFTRNAWIFNRRRSPAGSFQSLPNSADSHDP